MLGKLIQVFYIDIDYKEARFTGILAEYLRKQITLFGRNGKPFSIDKNKISSINVLYHGYWKVKNKNFVRGDNIVR